MTELRDDTVSWTLGDGGCVGFSSCNGILRVGILRNRGKMCQIAAAFFLLFFHLSHLISCANLCNDTVTSPSHVTVPEVTPQNRGNYLFCTIQVRGGKSKAGKVIKLRFTRLKLGELTGPADPSLRRAGHQCTESYMIIYDGVNQGKDLGKYCGESEQYYNYYAENEQVDVVIVAEHFDYLIDYEFHVSWVDKRDLPERFGPRPDLFPHIRGNLVANSFCERVFQDCSRLQTCMVQSPGFPGIYPRNLKCRYYLSTKQPYIKLYVDRLHHSLFNVAGQDCDSLYSCPYFGIAERPCSSDLVRIYDGVDEYSPLIGTFCGIGDFPSSIIGTGKELFLEFNTDHDGPFLGTGFDLRVGHLPGNINSYNEQGLCQKVFRSEDLKDDDKEGIFLSLEHWYPPDTNCSYTIEGRPHEVVRLNFPSFKIGRIENPLNPDAPGECRESLTLFDASWADGSRVIKTFCDGFSRPLEKFDFVSTGNALFVSFLSKTGSYSGSALQFWGQFDFFDNRRDGQPRAGTACDEIFDGDASSPSGSFQSPRNTMVFKDPQAPLQCNYDISANPRDYGRVRLTLKNVDLKPARDCQNTCWLRNDLDHIEVHDPLSTFNATRSCISNCSDTAAVNSLVKYPLSYLSKGPELRLSLHINHETSLIHYFKSVLPLFQAEYELVHPPVCGPALIPATKSGRIRFPMWTAADKTAINRDLVCIWDLQVNPRRNVEFSLANFTFMSGGGCDQASLEVRLPDQQAGEEEKPFFRQCDDGDEKRNQKSGKRKVSVLKSENIPFGYVQIEFKMREAPVVVTNGGLFQLKWSEVPE